MVLPIILLGLGVLGVVAVSRARKAEAVEQIPQEQLDEFNDVRGSKKDTIPFVPDPPYPTVRHTSPNINFGDVFRPRPDLPPEAEIPDFDEDFPPNQGRGKGRRPF